MFKENLHSGKALRIIASIFLAAWFRKPVYVL
jgi:hypothetical protein